MDICKVCSCVLKNDNWTASRVLKGERICKHCASKQTISRHRKRVYGITDKEYDDMRKLQDNKCRICGYEFPIEPKYNTDRPNIDHCHTTGTVRGLLCQHCNTGLGKFNDDINLLSRAIAYLQGDLL